MSKRTLLLELLVFGLAVGAFLLLTRHGSDDEASRAQPRHVGGAAPASVLTAADEGARLEGADADAPIDAFHDADVATTLDGFRAQPPNVPAAAVARLRHLVAADPELLEHLVRVALGNEVLDPAYVPPTYPYEARQAAQWAIEALGRPTARILGARLATEMDPRMRRAIYWLLRRIGAEAAPATEGLLGRMRDTGLDARERGEAILVLGGIGSEARIAVPDLLALLRDPDDPLLDAALVAIYRLAGMTDEVRDAFVDLLAIDDDDLLVDVLQVVVDQMATDVEPLRPTLCGLVRHGGPDVRRMALGALMAVGVKEPASIQLVGRRLEEGDEDEEHAAVAVLLASGDAGRSALLGIAERTELLSMALRVTSALLKDGVGGEIPPRVILRLFQECDRNALDDVVFLTIDKPGGLPAAAALPILRAELGDPESDRRWAAAEILSTVRGDDGAVLDLLVEALEVAEVREFAFDALGRLPRLDVRVVPVLEAQAGLRRLSAVNQLGALSRESTLARDALRRLTTSADAEVRDFAVRVTAEFDPARSGR